jgi:hypothetical protein
MTPKKFVIAWVAWFLWFLCMLGGIFAAAGVVALVWGGDIVNGALGNPPNTAHPAFWIFIVLIWPCMLIGAAGGLAAIVFPVYYLFRIPMRRKGQPWGWVETYIKVVQRVMKDEWKV